jgi:phospholipase/carboxylesterase
MRKQIGGIECIVENPGTSTSQSNVVILFHGYGADFSDLAPLADMIDPEGEWTWIFPNGPDVVDIGYHMTGRAWFPISVEELQQAMLTGKPRDYAGSEPKDLDAILVQLEEMLKEIKGEYKHIVLGGFSQGGMVASHLLKSAGDQLKGALLLSTVLLNSKKLLASLEGVSPKAFVQSHGSQDPVLHIKQGMDLFQLLKKNGWQGRWVEFSGGHEIPPVVLQKSKELLKSLL